MCFYRTEDGLCKKHSTEEVTSYCVDGPCPDEVLTNADRIPSMSVEELADMFAEFAEENPSDDANAWYEWLKRTAEED